MYLFPSVHTAAKTEEVAPIVLQRFGSGGKKKKSETKLLDLALHVPIWLTVNSILGLHL